MGVTDIVGVTEITGVMNVAGVTDIVGVIGGTVRHMAYPCDSPKTTFCLE